MSGNQKALFRFGFMTDNHLGSDIPGMTERTESVLRLFRREHVELILEGGDFSDSFQPEQIRNLRRMYESVWPDTANRPHLFAIAAGHDRNGHPTPQEAYPEILSMLGQTEVNPYLVFHGFPFLGLSQSQPSEILRDMLAKAEAAFPDGPIFVLTHEPAYGTVYRSAGVNGDMDFFKILDGHTRVIHLSGHIHTPVFFEQQIWQGRFTAVNGGSLTYWKDDPRGRGSRVQKSCDALIFDVFKDKIIVYRYDGITGKECAVPWDFPLPMVPETAPYRPEVQEKTCTVPEFKPDGKIVFQPDKVPFVQGLLCLSGLVLENTVHRYRITLFEEQKELAILDYFPVSALPESTPDSVKFAFPVGMLQGNTNYFGQVVPMNIFNKAGAPLPFSFHTTESAVKYQLYPGITLEYDGKKIPVPAEGIDFATAGEYPSFHFVIEEAARVLAKPHFGISFDFACNHKGRPATLMSAGTCPQWDRHIFPTGYEPFHRHCFDLTHADFSEKKRRFPGNNFAVLLCEGESGEYQIRNIRCFTW